MPTVVQSPPLRSGSPAVEGSRTAGASQLSLPWERDAWERGPWKSGSPVDAGPGSTALPAEAANGDVASVLSIVAAQTTPAAFASDFDPALLDPALLDTALPDPPLLDVVREDVDLAHAVSDDDTGPPPIPDSHSRALLRPETLHPALWLGHQIGRSADDAVPSDFPLLDRELPGGGWPRRVLTELLLPHPGIGEIRLLGRTLAALQRAGRLVMLFDPPAQLSAGALEQLGLDLQQLLVVDTRSRVLPGADSLWALEQALKSGHVGGVVAWLPPRLRAERLRRLQLAAHSHDGPAFVLRETAAQQRPTSAPLRLALRPGGADALAVRLLKRRGPPLESSLKIDLPPVLSTAARSRVRAGVTTPSVVAERSLQATASLNRG